jgi:hypothetical protein
MRTNAANAQPGTGTVSFFCNLVIFFLHAGFSENKGLGTKMTNTHTHTNKQLLESLRGFDGVNNPCWSGSIVPILYQYNGTTSVCAGRLHLRECQSVHNDNKVADATIAWFEYLSACPRHSNDNSLELSVSKWLQQ